MYDKTLCKLRICGLTNRNSEDIKELHLSTIPRNGESIDVNSFISSEETKKRREQHKPDYVTITKVIHEFNNPIHPHIVHISIYVG